MSVKKTTTPPRPPQFPRLRLSTQAKIVLRARYLAKNMAGMIVETPKHLLWRVATDVAQAERLYPPTGRLPRAAQRWYKCMARLDFLPNSPTLMNAGRRLQQLSACFVLPVEDDIDSLRPDLPASPSIQHVTQIPEHLPRLFVTPHDVSPAQHVRMQSVFQRYSDSGVWPKPFFSRTDSNATVSPSSDRAAENSRSFPVARRSPVKTWRHTQDSSRKLTAPGDGDSYFYR